MRRSSTGKSWREEKSALNVWSSDTEHAGDRQAESLWVRIPGKASRDDNIVGACYGPPDRLRKEVKSSLNSSDSQTLARMGETSDICWKGNIAIQAVKKISGQRQG